jgi:hypothetical protein
MSNDLDDPRRGFLVKALSLGLFAGPNLVSLFQASHALGDIPGRLPEGRSIYKLQGSVAVNGKAADISTRIGPNSLVKTGSNSLVIFVVANDAFIMRSNSQLEMGSSDGLIIEGMRILSGRLLSVFGKRKKPHTITTSTATIGIRGTGMYVESDPERSYICTCYGQTRIIASADPNIVRDVVTEYHDEPFYVLPTATSGGKLIVPAPVINHTDSELILIEELVGRAPPFENSDGGYGVPRKYDK